MSLVALTWPGPIPPLPGYPDLQVTVTRPHDQAALHRELAAIGYVPEIIEEGAVDTWLFVHPDTNG